jgi:pSer/pThr/pTyr-binding forkhead associated (FHA) protein
LTLQTRKVIIDHELTVGRDADSEIRIPDPRVSKSQARIFLNHGRPMVEDLGSTNGTRVRGKLITAPHEFASGDLVSFGGTTAWRIVHDVPTVRL